MALVGIVHESRTATVSWVGGSGDWSTPGNWSTAALPGTNDDVLIDVVGLITVTHSAGTHTVKSILCQESLALSGGSLTVSNTLQVNSGFLVSGATLIGPAILPPTDNQPIAVTGFSASFERVTLGCDLTIANSSSLQIAEGLTLTNGAMVTLNSVGSGTYLFAASGPQLIGGTGEIIFAGSSLANRLRLGQGGPSRLTLGPGVSVHGRGVIDDSANSSLDNQGTIQADVAGQGLNINLNSFTNSGALYALNGAALTINGTSWTNSGTIHIDNSTLELQGTFSSSSATTGFSRVGGTVNIIGTVSEGLALNATTGSWSLSGTVNGGTVSASGGAELIANGGTLSGVNLATDLAIANGNSLWIDNGITFVGGATITLNSTVAGTVLYLTPGNQTFGGSGQIIFGGTGVNNRLRLGQGGLTRLTLGPGVTVRGRGIVDDSSSSSLDNQGTIQADVPGQSLNLSFNSFTNSGALYALNGATLVINCPAWTNRGIIHVDNSTLDLAGTFSGSSVATGFTRVGGTVSVSGTINGGLVLNGTTGSWSLSGTINGGTVSASGGAQLIPNGGTLAGVNLATDLAIPNGNGLWIENGLTLLAGTTITLNSTGAGAILYFRPGAQTIGGSGQIILGAAGANNRLRLGQAGPTWLTLSSGVIVRGRGIVDNSSSSSLDNQGTIQADVTGQTLNIGPNSFTNSGVLNSFNGATLIISSATWTNSGTIHVSNSTLELGGTFSGRSATTGFYSRTSRVVNLSGTINDGLNLTTTTGSWSLSGTINGGTVSASGGAQLIPNGGTLSGVNLATDLAIGNGNALWIDNGINLMGGATIALNSTGSATILYLLPGTQTIGGTGQIILGTAGPGNRLRLGQGGSTLLRLGADVTVRGRGFIDDSSVSSLYNEGTIQAEVQTLNVNIGSLTNSGVLRAQSGILQFNVNTDIVLLPASELGVVIQGPGQSGRIEVGGMLNAAGAFDVTTGLNYVQQIGTAYTVLTYGSLNGTFSSVTGLDLGEGFFFDPVFGATSLTLTSQTSVRPFITGQPRSQVAIPGENIVFRVEAGGPGPFSYQWYNDSVLIPGQTTDSLTLANVQLADAGPRHVVVQNSFGSVTSAVATLTVILPPSITIQPASQSVLPGAMVTFTVSADGTGPLHYQWRHNGANILNATSSTYAIASVQVADGGSYSVVVANEAAAVSSNPAQLVVIVDQLAGGNNFAARVTISGNSGLISSSNTLATVEAGEPNHGGKLGGKSIWYTWKAPTDGIARLSLAGSSFDTLLGVYVGNALNALSSRAQDDDSGGFLTSAVQFNVVSQTDYAIAIDGLAGAAGTYVLSWQLEADQTLPVITTQPHSVIVPSGASAMFSVVSDGTSFQWFLNGTAIAAATAATLTVANVGSDQVGNYVVRVTEGTRFIVSTPAALEIGESSTAFSQSKFEDLFAPSGGGGGRTVPAGASSGFVPVAAGAVESRVFNNRGATTEPGEPIHCGVVGGASKWFGLRPTSDGVLQIDTMGSGIDTVLAVYTGQDLLGLTMITCDDNNAPDGVRSLVRFNAVGGTSYAVVVDGINGAQGAINLNWRFGRAPIVSSPSVTRSYAPGRNVVLLVELAEPTPDVRFQWQRNGRNLFEATGSSITLSNLMSSQVGTYSVVVDNFAGIVTNTAAVIDLASPVEIAIAVTGVGPGMNVHLTGPIAQGFVLESTTNFVHWMPMLTNTTPSSLTFTDPSVTNQPCRFYRLTPWP